MAVIDNFESADPDRPLKKRKKRLAPPPPPEPEKPKVRSGWSKVVVTKGDIDKGAVATSTQCPVARAFVRCVPSAYIVRVFHASVRLYFGAKHGGWKEFQFDESVADRIRVYDLDGKMEPFEFELLTHPHLQEIKDK